MRFPLLAAAGCILIAHTGCVTQNRTGPMETAQGNAAVTYKIIRKVESTGKASVISPVVSPYMIPAAINDAAEEAVGTAIYDVDDIDIVLNPKKKVQFTNYLIIGVAEVTIKGQGAAIQK